MKQLQRHLSLLLAVLCFGISHGQTDQLFEQGNQKYAAQQYQEAINAWSQILDKDQHDASLYFNLGNAHYKLNNVGPSVYYYEKALQLDPLDTDIQNNLSFAENARVDAIEPLPQTIFSKWYANVAGLFTFNGWAWIAVTCSLVFVVLFLLYYFSVSERRKRIYFVTSTLSIVVLICTVAIAFQTYSDYENDKPAIIFSESTDVKTAPNMGSESAFVLHEGTKVQILTSENDWVQVQVADGKNGWMPTADLKRL